VIDELRIRGLGVIDSADIAPGPGLTCLTGETGAGKTMVLTAVGLLRGEKCPASLVRGERARVDALFTAPPEVAEAVVDLGAEMDDDDLIVSRVVPAEGRSRTFVGGVPVAAAAAADLTERLVVVHGQADQWRLRTQTAQRNLLDEYAGADLAEEKGRYQEHFEEVIRLRSQVRHAQQSAQSRAAEIVELRQRLEQVSEVDPQPGEDELLAAEAERLTNVEDLVQACATAHTAVVGTEDDVAGDVLTRLGAAHRALLNATSHDPQLAPLSDRAAELLDVVADFAGDVASQWDRYEADPARLAWVQQRRADLNRLTRVMGGTVDQVRAWAEQASQRLSELEDDGVVERLTEQLHEAERSAAEAASALTALREAAAAALTGKVTSELRGLAMPDASISIQVSQREDVDGLPIAERVLAYGPEGVDQVTFLLTAHRGGAPAPLGQGASGGELSRVMLAIEVSLAATQSAPTMIFDEIDAGVGGKAAVEIGRRLARLARHTQVIVVTHLPQVAAFADTHLRVQKNSSGQVSATSVEPVTGESRRRELARMLAGQDESTHALAHSDELLQLAADEATSQTSRA
jgi:DNA repair protein RecN (Recombination protein N)